MTGTPGAPSAAGVSDFGRTSCVQLLPPPLAGANFSSGISIRTVMPFSSLERIVDFAIGSVDGTMPPPRLFEGLWDKSLRLAFSDAGPSAASLARSLALFFVPFAVGRIRAARSALRCAESRRSDVEGLLRALWAARAARRSLAFAVFDAASFGRFFVWLTSAVSVAVALAVFVAFFAIA